MVVEEDTSLILSTKKAVEKSDKKTGQLIRDSLQTISDSPIPGMALIRGKAPYRFLAIIRDFNLTPSWSVEWVKDALDDIFEIADRYGLKTMSLPLLATVHGSMAVHEFINILFDVLENRYLNHLNTICLIVSEYDIDEVVNASSERLNHPLSD